MRIYKNLSNDIYSLRPFRVEITDAQALALLVMNEKSFDILKASINKAIKSVLISHCSQYDVVSEMLKYEKAEGTINLKRKLHIYTPLEKMMHNFFKKSKQRKQKKEKAKRYRDETKGFEKGFKKGMAEVGRHLRGEIELSEIEKLDYE